MYRVTGIARLVADNWQGPSLEIPLLTRVLLLHDIGNMAKIEPDSVSKSDFGPNASLECFLRTREAMIEKFGLDDHAISAAIGREVGLTINEIDFMNRKIFVRNDETIASADFNLKIAA